MKVYSAIICAILYFLKGVKLLENKKNDYKHLSIKYDNFIHSNIYIFIVVALAVWGFAFQLEKYAISILLIITAINLVLTEDFTPNLITIIMIAMCPLARHGQVGYFDMMYYVAPLIVISIVAHFIIYKPRIRGKRYLGCTIAVAFSIIVSGLFSPYFFDNFTMPGIYYYLGLSIGTIVFYLIFECYIPKIDEKMISYFAHIMLGVGIMGICMIISMYIRNRELLNISTINQFTGTLQLGNNLSCELLISMPFAFYLSVKNKKLAPVYFTIGFLQYAALMLSLSRGGMIFSTIIFPFILFATIKLAKDNRINLLITLLICIAVSAFLLKCIINGVGEILYETVSSKLIINSGEAREKLYGLAWENFKRLPIFGTGLGYMGDLSFYNPKAWCMYWYHSTVFQILGSLGITGVICYGYQYIVRGKEMLKNLNFFGIFTALSFIGYELYQVVNVGNFVPVPYVIILLFIFVVLERYNEYLAAQPSDTITLNLGFKKYKVFK